MTAPKAAFLKNIEEAIHENGTLACPNLACNEKIVSRILKYPDGKEILEYQCTNGGCTFHKLGKIELVPPQIAPPKKSFLNLSKFQRIAALAVLILTLGIGLGYIFSMIAEQGEESLSDLQNQIESIETQQAKRKAAQLHSHNNTSTNSVFKKTVATSSSKNDFSAKQLVQQIQQQIQAGQFDLVAQQFSKCLTSEFLKQKLQQADHHFERLQLTEMLANSYEASQNKFTFFILKKQSSFEMLEKFLETFDTQNQKRDFYLAKAYYHFPNFSKAKLSAQKRRQLHLTSLKYYLSAAKNQQFTSADSYSLEAINDILKTYRIFKFDPSKGKNFQKIETIVQQKNQAMLSSRIDWVDRLISTS